MAVTPSDPHGRLGRFIPSPAMAVACCALVVAATGVGVAASGAINGSSIRNGTIAGAKLKNRTITGVKLAKGLVKKYPLVVAPSDQGFFFDLVTPAVTGYVDYNNVWHGTGAVTVSHPATGVYCLAVSGHSYSPLTDTAVVAPDYSNDLTGVYIPSLGEYASATAELMSTPDAACANDFEVRTFIVGTAGVVANGPVQSLAPLNTIQRAVTHR